MKPVTEEYFHINKNERQIILSNLKSYANNAYNFYKKILSVDNVATFFLHDLMDVIDNILLKTNNDKLSKILYDLKLINTPLNKKIIEIDKKCYKKLYDFQKEDLKLIAENLEISGYDCGFLQMTNPGLGKTRTSICQIKSYYKSSNLDFDKIPLVVFVPKTLIAQWIESIKKVFPDNTISTNPLNKADIYVLNYEKVFNLDYTVFTCIIDEAHYLHNFKSKRFIEAFDKLKLSQFTIIMTGTPIRESILDVFILYSLVTKRIQNVGLLERIYNYLGDNIEYAKILIPKTIKEISSIKTKKKVFDNVGDTITRPLVIKVDNYQFMKQKLALDKFDSTYSKYITILKKVKELKVKKEYDEYFEEIYSNMNESPDVIKRKLIAKFKTVHAVILQYVEIIHIFSKQSLKSKIWKSLLDDTLKYVVTNHYDKLCSFLNQNKKVLIVSKSRSVIPLFLEYMKTKCNINGISLDAEDSYTKRYDKIKQFEYKKDIKFLISTYPIVEAGIDLPYVDNIFILDFPFRPYSLIQLTHRTQRLTNIESNINITFLKLTYNYNILNHHMLILTHIMTQVQQHYNVLKEIINDKD